MTRCHTLVVRALMLALIVGLAATSVRAQRRLGPEFIVNSTTGGSQGAPAVAINDDGTFVVVWISIQQDGNGWGVIGQRFAESGTRLGGEFQVNTYWTGDQEFNRIAADSAGNFVVVWKSEAQDGSGTGIFGQRFDASATRLGSEFRVNTTTVGDQQRPSVARAPGGSFVVVWDTYAASAVKWDVLGQRFDSAGNKVGSEFAVNSYTTGEQWQANVAVDAAGNFLVVWYSPQNGTHEVFARRFNSSGTALGAEFVVNTYTTDSQYRPVVAADRSNDGFVVAWLSSPQDGDGQGVFAQRLDASGVRLGSEFLVNSQTTGGQVDPQISAGNNGFVVVWRNYTLGSGWRPKGQSFTAGGRRLGAEFWISSYTTLQDSPFVARAADGRFVVAWGGTDGGVSAGTMAQRFDPEPEREGKVADFHADAMADLLWYNSSTGEAALWRMNGGTATAFTTIATIPDLNWSIVGGGDFGGGGKADLVWYHRLTGQTYLWTMNGATPVSTTPIATVSDLNWQIQATGDTDGDGKTEVVWQNQSTGAVYVWRMNGSSVLSISLVATIPDLHWWIAGARDFNGDGKADLLWKNGATGQVYIWLMSGATPTSIVPVATITDSNWRVYAGGDLTGDGKSDLVWRNLGTGQVYLWTLSGGTVVSTTLIATVADNNWRLIGSGDVGGDQKADLLWHNTSTGQASVWQMNGSAIASISVVGTVADSNWGPQALH